MGEYAEGRGEALSTHVAGARAKLHDLLMNDWHRRVSDAEKDAAARVAAQELGAVVVAAQLMRLARDAAYATLSARDPFDGTQPFVRWFDLADELAGDAPEGEGAEPALPSTAAPRVPTLPSSSSSPTRSSAPRKRSRLCAPATTTVRTCASS